MAEGFTLPELVRRVGEAPERYAPRGRFASRTARRRSRNGAHELGTLAGVSSPEEIAAAMAEADTAHPDGVKDAGIAAAVKKAPRIVRFTVPKSAC
jgi:hypothetical protein